MPSDNREEARARRATRSAMPRKAPTSRVVSGGDPGVFAMAAAVCEADRNWPAMPGARSRSSLFPASPRCWRSRRAIGAPLGHDFCALSLSDNLKPWELIERRLDAAAQAGFVIALYNPVSRARPWQLGQRIRAAAPASAADRRRSFSAAPSAGLTSSIDRDDARRSRPVDADMATLVIVGSRETRVIARPGRSPLVYTPRAAAEVSA